MTATVLELETDDQPIMVKGAGELLAMLRRKYSLPEYAFMPQVRDAAGFDAHRTADAMALGLYPSRGCELQGFELKVSRSDWLRELADASKAEALCQYCDRWWIIAGNKDIVRKDELPGTWGLMVPRSSGLFAVINAPKLTPVEISRSFAVVMIRRAVAHLPGDDEIKSAVDLVTEPLRKALDEERRKPYKQNQRAESELNDLRGQVLEFERRSGLSIRYACPKELQNIGGAVRLILGNATFRTSELRRAIEEAEAVVKSLKSAHETIAGIAKFQLNSLNEESPQ